MKIWADPQLYHGKLTSYLSFGAEGPLNYGGVVKKEITLTANRSDLFCAFISVHSFHP